MKCNYYQQKKKNRLNTKERKELNNIVQHAVYSIFLGKEPLEKKVLRSPYESGAFLRNDY